MALTYLEPASVDPDGATDPNLAIVDLLNEKRRARAARIKRYSDYYDGEHNLAFASEKFRKAFGGLFDEFADNWCEIVVDSVEDRLEVQGFRFDRDDPVAGDDDAWRIWQENQMDSRSSLAYTEALVGEESYAIVDPYGPEPVIHVNHPSQVIVAYEPGAPHRRKAALKRWVGDDGKVWVTLYTPKWLLKYRSEQDADAISGEGGEDAKWVRRQTDDELWPLANPLEVVPVVPFVNKPRLLRPGKSELKSVIPLQDAVNKLVADMMVASEFGAFRQRWVTGMDIPIDPETKQEVEPFDVALNKLLVAEDSEARFGTFEETNLGNIVKAIDMAVQHIASQTRTPPHYLNASADRLSGESIKAAETGLVAKVHRKQNHFGESNEEVLRLCFKAKALHGDTEAKKRSEAVFAETIWRDPESRTESEHIDAVTKKAQMLGIPTIQAWEDAGYSPTQIRRMLSLLEDEMNATIPDDYSTDPDESETDPDEDVDR